MKRILVIGGGPCGLGAAWRLNALGHTDWALYEGASDWGGLAGSEQDSDGFWWDYGGHVLFSHYAAFDRLMEEMPGGFPGWIPHRRESWVWMQDRFIPYPLQHNIRYLPREVVWECLEGLIEVHRRGTETACADFDDWIVSRFGQGLAKWFMRPYNAKVWACSLREMAWDWVGERVAPTDLAKVLKSLIFEEDACSWGPNATFLFPLQGGTGAIWRALARALPARSLFPGKAVSEIRPRERRVLFEDGSQDGYEALISTLPLDRLHAMIRGGEDLPSPGKLAFSSTHLVGLALKGQPPEALRSKCWMYFPEGHCPFYRGTVFSNYSPNNVPDAGRFWSLLLEVSAPSGPQSLPGAIIEGVVRGALGAGLVREKADIHHTWYRCLRHGYPIPTKERNPALFSLLQALRSEGILSRGRFGAWRYEVGNMDHAFMQGVEAVNALLLAGEELTLWYPSLVNALHPLGMKR